MMMMTRTKLTRLVPFTYFPKCSLKTAANCGEKQSPERRRHVELPKELLKNVILLSCEFTAMGGVSDVYVVGINKESNKQVEDIINFFKPEAVFLELCSSREHILYRDKIKVPTMQDMIAMWKKKHSIRGILYSWSMAKLAKEEDVYFGVEFRSAYREAKKYGGKVALGDRAHHITLKRTWRNLPLKHIIRLFDPSSYPEINFSDSLSFPDYAKIRAKVIEMLPTVKETIVHERDQYMSYTLLKVASENRSVVAVVGREHLQGIKKNWKQPIKMQDLVIIPPPKLHIPVMKLFAYVGIVVAGVTIITKTYL